MKKALICILFCIPMTSMATLDGYVGLGLGMSDVSLETSGEDVYDPSASFAFRIGMVFSETIQLGLHLGSYIATAEDTSGNELEVSIMPQLIELNYLFEGTRNGFFLGVAAGTVQETIKVTITTPFVLTAENTESSSAFGGNIGYNFQTGANHSFGLEGKFLQIAGDPEDYTMWSAHGTWNYWF